MNIIKEQTGLQNIVVISNNLVLIDTSSTIVFKDIQQSYTALVNVSPVSEISVQQQPVPLVNIYYV